MKQTDLVSKRIPCRRLLRFVPAIAWMAVIYLLSSRTGDEINAILPFFQKFFPFMEDFNWGHFVSYFILAMTIDFGIGARADRFWVKIVIVLLCGLYGVTDEYHQSFVGGRMPDPIDVRNDIIGAAIWTAVAAISPIRALWRKIAS
ncbi:VanZ family protein [Paenibacillus alkaliterrae]|uniref:VanZ family protein n=1 Tax=Paenibacillus alkaliterrae TaxID=320909 RepID=UPI001F2ECF9E|nr:VanZ family protein [Paenibacillus alkaliterrae]MCF2936866.1 VanZ family protein [Paenibacillus alkaliterrae]